MYKLNFAVYSASGPELSEIIEPLQNFLLSSTVYKNFFTDSSSMNACVELHEWCANTAFQSRYDNWAFVEFCAHFG